MFMPNPSIDATRFDKAGSLVLASMTVRSMSFIWLAGPMVESICGSAIEPMGLERCRLTGSRGAPIICCYASIGSNGAPMVTLRWAYGGRSATGLIGSRDAPRGLLFCAEPEPFGRLFWKLRDGGLPVLWHFKCVNRYSAARRFCVKEDACVRSRKPSVKSSEIARMAVFLETLRRSASHRVGTAILPLLSPLYRAPISSQAARAVGERHRQA
jgi:hypothetical protein